MHNDALSRHTRVLTMLIIKPIVAPKIIHNPNVILLLVLLMISYFSQRLMSILTCSSPHLVYSSLLQFYNFTLKLPYMDKNKYFSKLELQHDFYIALLSFTSEGYCDELKE